MGFGSKVKKIVEEQQTPAIKTNGLVTGFSIIKKEQEEFRRRKERFEKGGGSIYESYVTPKNPTFTARFLWDGDADTLQHTLMHGLPEKKKINGVNYTFTRKRQCNIEAGLDDCYACGTVNENVRRKSRTVIFPLINREKREDKKGKVYSDNLSYILAGAKTQLDIFLEKAKELEDLGLKFNEVDFVVKKLNAGTKQATWYLTPQLKTKRKLTKEEIEKFKLFAVEDTQFAPLSNQEWKEAIYVAEDEVNTEEGNSKEYQW